MNFIIGVDDFGKIIKEKYNFIDKSLFIKEVLDNRGTEVIVITRPRRFGKTLNMSMLHHFLGSEVNNLKTEGMFDHLKIAKEGSAYMDHQGRYPVISITFKAMACSSYDQAKQIFAELLSQLYGQHRVLLLSEALYSDEKLFFERVLNRKASDADLIFSLQRLSNYLHRHHGVKPWILIDEYDTPIQSGHSNNHYKEIVELMRGVLGNVLKGNADIHQAVITGILQISKESLFSGLNNLRVYSLLNEKYAEYFGFTGSEVDEALKKINLHHLSGEIKGWYNGYHIGQCQIYNPWSIANCIAEKGALRPYWVNTSNSELIKTSMALAEAIVKEKFEQILAGNPIEVIITEKMVFGDLKTNTDALWSLLLFSGYLTVRKATPIDTEFNCELQTPNQEVAALYRTVIRGWFTDSLSTAGYQAFLENLTTGDLDTFLERLKRFLKESSSFFDVGGKNPEKFYHGFVLGLIVSLADTHTVQSNKESGYGRYDVMIIPKDIQKLGLILEFKVAKKGVTLKQTAQEALAQIEARDYETELRQRGIQNILKIGLAFRKKEVEMAFQSSF
ncbi:MAG: putative AAA-ATPase [Gammaproteobacteria bacterium]|jgi:hypothetical protein|nr:putative AAA-ATPase [Gammaproteobacteria bacterium]